MADCGRCSRSGHTEKNCFALRDVWGNPLSDRDDSEIDSTDDDETDYLGSESSDPPSMIGSDSGYES